MNLIDLLKEDEGTGPVRNGRLMPYQDSEGFWTIGYGRCIEKVGISFAEADYLLEQSIKEIRYDVNARYGWFSSLDEVRQSVVLSMVYNLGLSGFKTFKKTIKAIEKGLFASASVEMLDSLWAEQVGSRAVRLSQMMSSGEWV